MQEKYRGGCLCGAVAFEVDAFLPDAAHCHCSMCRKFHGAPFATYASVRSDDFRWVQGSDALKAYTAGNGTSRTFCRHCGSSLMFSSPRAPDNEVEIALGAVDGDLPITPSAHIFVDSAASWDRISDALPAFAEERDSVQRNKCES